MKVRDYQLDDEIVEEPFKTLGRNYGPIKILTVREFVIRDQTFAYLLLAKRGKYEKNNEKFQTEGISFTYAFVDEDGDGKFERLLNSPLSDLMVPDWIDR